MNKFDDREKSFEKKFVRDEEIQFKINARRNKYLGEWAADKLGKIDKATYVQEVIKSDFAFFCPNSACSNWSSETAFFLYKS